MQQTRSLQLYYGKADPKVDELRSYTEFSICTSFQVTNDFSLMKVDEKSESSYYSLSY